MTLTNDDEEALFQKVKRELEVSKRDSLAYQQTRDRLVALMDESHRTCIVSRALRYGWRKWIVGDGSIGESLHQ